MAKLSSGILGGISGTVGNVVGGRWRGIDYIRSKPATVNNPNTEAQKTQRLKFKLVGQFLKSIRPFVNIGFKNSANKRTAMNAAMSINLRQAITGEYPDLGIAPDQVVVSSGDLYGADTFDMDLTTAGSATITWSNDAGIGRSANTDAAMILLYNTDTGEVTYNLHGASREDESLALTIPTGWSGANIAGYLAFRSETNRDVSNGIYLGEDTAA